MQLVLVPVLSAQLRFFVIQLHEGLHLAEREIFRLASGIFLRGLLRQRVDDHVHELPVSLVDQLAVVRRPGSVYNFRLTLLRFPLLSPGPLAHCDLQNCAGPVELSFSIALLLYLVQRLADGRGDSLGDDARESRFLHQAEPVLRKFLHVLVR